MKKLINYVILMNEGVLNMNRTIVSSSTSKRLIEGKEVIITNFFHTKHEHGRRTIRTEYIENMPHSAGGWLANTTTERVVEGHGANFKVLIPEHRVA